MTMLMIWLPRADSMAQDLVSYVQPLCGTAPSTTRSATRHGSGTELNANTIPAVTVPFGMTQWTPETQRSENKCVPPYRYNDTKLTGFRASHWLSGSCTQDYGSFTIIPAGAHLELRPEKLVTTFKHQDEKSAPHYYQVQLRERNLTAELTATKRAGMLRFTATKADSVYLLIKPNSDRGEGYVRIDKQKGLIWGYNPAHRIYQGWGESTGFSGYFVIQLPKPIIKGGVFRNGVVVTADSVKNGEDVGAYIGVALKAGEKLTLRTGTSFTSLEGAFKNLSAEIKGWDLDALVKQNKSIWDTALGQIRVDGGSEQKKRIFYTAFYHTMQHPRCFNDVDGKYPRFAGNYVTEKLNKGNYYDDLSMWDIYRAQLPLFEILDPALINDLVRSVILKGQQGGWLPIFPCWNSYTAAMIGDHVTAFIASAYVRGIRDYDVQEAYRLMRQNAFNVPDSATYKAGKGRRAITSYLKYGYVPLEDPVADAFHKNEQVSRTLEYAFDDHALAVVAAGLGKTADEKILTQRSKNYQKVIDPGTGLARGRYANGTWITPYHPQQKESYITEGTPQQYTFYVPHDVKGLAKAMGGDQALERHLDTLFNAGEYWHGNEPGQQIPFLYNYTNSPWKTQLRVDQIMQDEYTDGPGGLSGNDDAGQVSAWYVFAAMGMYPVNPASDEYLLTSPSFRTCTIGLPGQKKFIVNCHGQQQGAIYIDHIVHNGRTYTKGFITHQMIRNGGTLDIYLSKTPNRKWAAAPQNRPGSLTK